MHDVSTYSVACSTNMAAGIAWTIHIMHGYPPILYVLQQLAQNIIEITDN